MDTRILSNANKRFQARDYAEALTLYEQAGAQYGYRVVEVNIALCRKALAGALESVGTAQLAAGQSNGEMDPATRYLLGREGAITLTADEARACLDLHAKLTSRKSVEAETKPVNPIPTDWPKDLVLAPLPESTNDFLWNRQRKGRTPSKPSGERVPGLSIVVPTFNRTRILDVTLACLVNQDTRFPFEVIVADDGSKDAVEGVVRRYESLLDIKYVRQKDYGYQLCAVRNLGLRTAMYDYVAILDCDMAPNPRWVESYTELLMEDDDVALIGPRKYIDTNGVDADKILRNRLLIENLPEVRTNNAVAGKGQGEISVDWRLEHFRETEDLRLCDTPFRYFSGGNVAFARKWLAKAGWFDEEFNHWGGEDNEFGYRLYRAGCFFRAVWGAMAYHQEPPGKENETDRAEGKKITAGLVQDKVPYFYRRIEPLTSARIHARPLVSVYIPAYNCADYIARCVDSALNQTVVDLEVCVCDDGSTDNTREILASRYGGNPRVRISTKVNGGIGSASNAAVRMASGYYIGQLDSDDYLEPDAVEICLKEFMVNRRLACVYTTNRNVNPDGSLIANGYNWPAYSREKLATAMIAHHFRMFTARAWHLTDGFDETITNAVDYDMYLKLSEVGLFMHVNKISYNRVMHGENTSIKKLAAQKENHFRVVNRFLALQGVSAYTYSALDADNQSCRRYVFKRNRSSSSGELGLRRCTNNPRPVVGVLRFSALTRRDTGSYISSRERSWDEHVAATLDPQRLEFRLTLLTRGVVPQLAAQTLRPSPDWFRLIIVTTTLLPENIKEQLNDVAARFSWIVVVEKGPDDWIGSDAMIANTLDSMPIGAADIPFFSFTLDDDDFLPVDYLEKVQPYVVDPNIDKFLTFKNGGKVLWSDKRMEICNYDNVDKPFIAIGLGAICKFDGVNRCVSSRLKSVFAGVNHFKLKDSFEYIVDDSESMFLWSHHRSQDTFGRFKSVAFRGEWASVPVGIADVLHKYPALLEFVPS